jgi:hypothetical protein
VDRGKVTSREVEGYTCLSGLFIVVYERFSEEVCFFLSRYLSKLLKIGSTGFVEQ